MRQLRLVRGGKEQRAGMVVLDLCGTAGRQLLLDDGHDLTKPILSLARPSLSRIRSRRLGGYTRFGLFRTFLCGSYIPASPLPNGLKPGLQIAKPFV